MQHRQDYGAKATVSNVSRKLKRNPSDANEPDGAISTKPFGYWQHISRMCFGVKTGVHPVLQSKPADYMVSAKSE